MKSGIELLFLSCIGRVFVYIYLNLVAVLVHDHPKVFLFKIVSSCSNFVLRLISLKGAFSNKYLYNTKIAFLSKTLKAEVDLALEKAVPRTCWFAVLSDVLSLKLPYLADIE